MQVSYPQTYPQSYPQPTINRVMVLYARVRRKIPIMPQYNYFYIGLLIFVDSHFLIV